MRNLAPESTSSLASDFDDNVSTRQSSLSTRPSTTPQSSRSSVDSSTHTRPKQTKRSSFKSNLKASQSTPSLSVRFEVPELPKMAQQQLHAAHPPQEYRTLHSARSLTRGSANAPGLDSSRSPQRPNYSKRYSAPAPISRKGTNRTSENPVPVNQRYSSARDPFARSRVTSFQSVASAPAVLVSTTPSPSFPPSQYLPLQHYIPCVVEQCTKHYTPSLLGPTFYSPQQPYKLSRKRALCVWHADQDLKLANHKAKCMWESMRQNAGRKTLGLIAAEFELYIYQCREDREGESEELEARQKKLVLGAELDKTKGKDAAGTGAGNDWEWKYTPRPCTSKGCGKQWYSPFDNKLYLFYHTARPSGLRPLTTLCPSCARADVESAEDKIQDRKDEAGAGPEWVEWCGQVKNDRRMEEEFWMQAQERVVREKRVAVVAGRESKDGVKQNGKEKKTKRRSEMLKGVCVVM